MGKNVSKSTTKTTSIKFRKFFEDKDGNIVIAQPANLPLVVWFISQALVIITRGNIEWLHHIALVVAFASIIYWALLEIFSGVCPWRKSLGLIVYTVAILILIKMIT